MAVNALGLFGVPVGCCAQVSSGPLLAKMYMTSSYTYPMTCGTESTLALPVVDGVGLCQVRTSSVFPAMGGPNLFGSIRRNLEV